MPKEEEKAMVDEKFQKDLAKHVLEIISKLIDEYNSDKPFDGMQTKNVSPVKGDEDFEARPKTMCEMLLFCQEFFDLMVRVLFKDEIFRMIDFDTEFMGIIDSLIKKTSDGRQRIPPEWLTQLFIKKGLIMFLLEMFFDPDLKRK